MASFEIISKDKKARVGKLVTAHGEVQTPVFLPVGTQATVKVLDSLDLRNLDCEMVLVNTYRLYLQPGADVIAIHVETIYASANGTNS